MGLQERWSSDQFSLPLRTTEDVRCIPVPSQTYSQIYNTSYAFWGGASTLNYTSPVRTPPTTNSDYTHIEHEHTLAIIAPCAVACRYSQLG